MTTIVTTMAGTVRRNRAPLAAPRVNASSHHPTGAVPRMWLKLKSVCQRAGQIESGERRQPEVDRDAEHEGADRDQ